MPLHKPKKKQHFVPQVYLRQFSSDQAHIWLFDKETGRTNGVTIADVAQRKYFYDFADELADNGIDVQLVENKFSELESDLEHALADVFELIQNDRLDILDKSRLSVHLAFQWVRTYEFRETIIKGSTTFLQSIIDEFVERNSPESSKDIYPQIELKKDYESIAHFLFMFNQSHMDNMITLFLRNYYWIIGRNNTIQPLFTSDNPIVLESHSEVEDYLGIGVGTYGSEFIWPINSEYVLILREKSHFDASSFYLEDTILNLSLDEVMRLNKLQVYQSTRQIFCIKDSLQVAQALCEEHADILQFKPSSNIIVESIPSPSDPLKSYRVMRRMPSRP
jgi:hypothetical protein